jgi:hypothetical protein
MRRRTVPTKSNAARRKGDVEEDEDDDEDEGATRKKSKIGMAVEKSGRVQT